MQLSIEELLLRIAQLPRDEQEMIIALIQKGLANSDESDRPAPPSIGIWL